MDGDEGSELMIEDAEDDATTDVTATLPRPIMPEVVCGTEEEDGIGVKEAAPPLGERPGDAEGVGKPLSGVDPRLSEVRGNLGNG